MDRRYSLIEMSDDEDQRAIEYYLNKNAPSQDSPLEEESEYIEIVIKKDDTNDSDPKIKDFINFCIKKRLFDDCFYDYNNMFSCIATKLPDTFDLMSKNGKDIKRGRFMNLMKNKYKYKGDLNYIYNSMDKEDKGFITWDEFRDFFLPFVQNITM